MTRASRWGGLLPADLLPTGAQVQSGGEALSVIYCAYALCCSQVVTVREILAYGTKDHVGARVELEVCAVQ